MEGERQRERETDRPTDRQTERPRECVCVCTYLQLCVAEICYGHPRNHSSVLVTTSKALVTRSDALVPSSVLVTGLCG